MRARVITKNKSETVRHVRVYIHARTYVCTYTCDIGTERENRSFPGRVVRSPENNPARTNKYRRANKISLNISIRQHSGMRKFIFAVYFVVVAAFVTALVVITVLAPIEETWATFTNTISNY